MRVISSYNAEVFDISQTGNLTFLHWEYWTNDDSPWGTDRHVHPYWQMEIVKEGPFFVECEGKTLRADSGDVFICPPGNWHCVHIEGPVQCWAMKFDLSKASENPFPPDIVEHSTFTDAMRTAILQLLSALNLSRTMRASLVAHLLAALVEYRYGSEKTQPPLLHIVRKFLETNWREMGSKVSVNDVARHIGYSKGHLSKLFHQKTGQPLKQFIDQERCRFAERLLTYSELNISEIALQMGFEDVFAFSRFFKRIKGKSPSEFRKKVD